MFATVTRRLVMSALLAYASTAISAPLDLDPSFGSNGLAAQAYPSGGDGSIRRGLTIAADSSNRPYVVAIQSRDGVFTSVVYVGRLTNAGQTDRNFGSGGWISIDVEAILSAAGPSADLAGFMGMPGICVDGESGDLALVGSVDSTSQMAAIRISSAGVPRATWGWQGIATVPLVENRNIADGCAFDSAGRLLLVGSSQSQRVDSQNGPVNVGSAMVVRLTSAGQIDTSFANGGLLVSPPITETSIHYDATQIAEGRDGGIYVGGVAGANTTNQLLLMKLSSSGTLVTSFGSQGTLVIPLDSAYITMGAMRPQHDGGVVITAAQNVGTMTPTAFIRRVTANGTLDSRYSYVRTVDLSSYFAEADALTIDAAGHLLLSGDYYPNLNNGPAQAAIGVYRLTGTAQLSSSATTGTVSGGGAISPDWIAFIGAAAIVRRRRLHRS